MSVNCETKCIGCYICQDICPNAAIELKADNHGFLYPIVDSKKCIECGKCDRSCPVCNDVSTLSVQSCYALKCKDSFIKKKSSSGGFFAIIAKYVIAQNGVVYGCYLNKKIEAVFGRATTWEECKPFMGAKYVQSDMRGVLKSLLKDVSEGRLVLFTGAPCQCMAVQQNVDLLKYRDKIIFAEYLCHGAPSPMVFDDFKKHMENLYEGKIVSFVFRDKEKIVQKPSCRGIRITIENHGKLLDVYNPKENDKYFEMFKNNYICRDCCYECPCIGYEKRYADFTMGDYWGCEVYHPEFYDKEGISVILVNSNKGIEIFEQIKTSFQIIELKKQEIVQPMLKSAPKRKDNYQMFWDKYEKDGFSEACAYIIKRENGFINRIKRRFLRFWNRT